MSNFEPDSIFRDPLLLENECSVTTSMLPLSKPGIVERPALILICPKAEKDVNSTFPPFNNPFPASNAT